MDINNRTRKILYAVVSEYLQTGEAVGSRTITKRHGIDLSPATVRNVMADLEEMGLLKQPHTSAGRVPTGSGLRVFIDSLLKVRGLSQKEKDDIRDRYGPNEPERNDVDGVMQITSRVLSDMTHYAGIVLAPNPARQKIVRLEFVPLSGSRYLCILVTSDGSIENKLIELDAKLDSRTLEGIHEYLNRLSEGLTIEELRTQVLTEMGLEKNRYDTLVSSALRLGHAITQISDTDVFVSGKANLLNPDQTDPESVSKMRALLTTLEEKERLVELLDRAISSERIQVFLGAETGYESLSDSAIVAVPYGPGDKPIGAVAVIGPTRMNYAKVISVVDFTADFVGQLLGQK